LILTLSSPFIPEKPMPPKRGQPPKPPEKSRTEAVTSWYTPEEKALLKKAYELSGTTLSLSRWIVGITIEEAEQIIKSHKKQK